MKACGINNTEIWMREGAYGTDKESGWRPEWEEHIAGDMSFIGSEYDGGYAEYVVWPAALCYDMPLDSFVDSAVFTVSGLTAWHMNEQIEIQPGQTIVITGASGGVGSFNVQIAANVHGANVFTIVGDLKDEAKLKELGASRVFSYRSETLADEILETNGGPVDAVLDVVGDALFATSLEVLKNGGKFCISGSAGGQQTQLDFRKLYLKHITMYGSVLGTRAEFQAMLKAIESGKIRPVVDRTFPLAEARDAQTYFKQRGKFGKIVLVP